MMQPLRHRLVNRRAHETIAIEHENQRYKLGLGREVVCIDPPRDDALRRTGQLGPIVEVFLNAQKASSPLDVLASDGAILISMLLQYGCPPEDISKSMKRNLDGTPASPLGRAAAFLTEAIQPGE